MIFPLLRPAFSQLRVRRDGTEEGAMRRTMVATAAALSLAAGTADAADVPRGPAPYYTAPVPLAYSWAGPYLGINVGYQWGTVTNWPADPAGFTGGIQGGYNWQSGQFVFGLEADIQASGAEDTFAATKFSNPWFGTVRGRLGWTFNNILLYGTAGFAFGGGRVEIPGFEQSNTHTGFAAGAGLEVGFTPNWSVRAEYLYVGLSSEAYAPTGASHGFDSSVLRFGVNYRF
jgi:outer membrane immunogenic protein